MNMTAVFLGLLTVCSIAFPLATTALAQEVKPARDPVVGKKLFLSIGCYECHGTFGQGGGRFGPKLAPNPLPANLFMRQLRRPVAAMPVYTMSDLSDAQVGDIIAYLQTIKPGKPAKDIPLLYTK